jgi:hypothetical protein
MVSPGPGMTRTVPLVISTNIAPQYRPRSPELLLQSIR